MPVANVNLSDEAVMSAWLGVTSQEVEEMERQAEQMMVDIKAFQARSQAADERFKRSSQQTRAIINQLMIDLKLQ
jgi:hypothetical protein